MNAYEIPASTSVQIHSEVIPANAIHATPNLEHGVNWDNAKLVARVTRMEQWTPAIIARWEKKYNRV